MTENFTIYPAIDLRRGLVVRLKEGDPERQTTYPVDPRAAAQRWLAAGAQWLHVVNLDGAFGESESPNLAALGSIARAADLLGARVQFGGGLRSLVEIQQALAAGASRVILGTAAVETPELITQALDRWGPAAICIGIDARDGFVKVRGWQSGSRVSALQLASQMAGLGIETVIYTNIARDGLGRGVDVPATQTLAKLSGLAVIASGGVAGLADIRAVRQAGLPGVIIGRALYEGQIELQEALAC